MKKNIFQKKSIEIEPLPTIKEILDRLKFLKYSTQLRNLAYQIQLFEFLRAIYRNYSIDRGLQNIYSMQICYVASNIIEHLAYCALKMRITFKSRDRKALALINIAKGQKVISKDLHKKLKKIIELRNDLHPERQIELHIKKVGIENIKEAVEAINELGFSLQKYLRN